VYDRDWKDKTKLRTSRCNYAEEAVDSGRRRKRRIERCWEIRGEEAEMEVLMLVGETLLDVELRFGKLLG
jgi:hypothetical protein